MARMTIRNPTTGAVVVDADGRMGRVIGYIQVSANGSMDVPAFATGVGLAKVHNATGFTDGLYNAMPQVTISGTTMTWTYPANAPVFAAIIIYMVR